ncbi:MAG TPA: adenosine-specific kinase [Acidobacteriota bacterium]|nr:adenosine-specific kinase [Acidobacteriota bacterium]HQM64301.1 adenosine-specific kinase [Acidobacteriota bacterium]
MELKTVGIEVPEGCNVIVGQSHFIKTVEDLYEAMVTAVPGVKFGVAFCEASGECLIRWDGTDDDLTQAAIRNARALAAGHTFVVLMRDAYPINVLPRIRTIHEVVNIFAATANPLQVIVAESEQGRGVLGVIDGQPPKGVEDAGHRQWRTDFLHRIGYKR